jgi:hypothetical protein
LAQPAAKRDLSTFDVCARLPAAAAVLGSTPDQTSAKTTMSAYTANCTYTIEHGDGATSYAMIWLYSHEMWNPAIAGDVEKIEGLGDDAYLGTIGTANSIHVLVAGDFMLDARADTPEQARGLAEVALEQLAE